jgi:hypothetical protein
MTLEQGFNAPQPCQESHGQQSVHVDRAAGRHPIIGILAALRAGVVTRQGARAPDHLSEQQKQLVLAWEMYAGDANELSR